MKLADAVVDTLAGWDLRYVFGVSGANIEHLHDALGRAGTERIRSVLARSEIGAAYMADVRARVRRTLGVCCATSGAGMMNLAVGIAESYAESVPVLAIIGQPPTNLAGRGAFQDGSGVGRAVDAIAMFGAMAKYVARIDDPGWFWSRLREAAGTALSGRPGPAVLLVPRDMFEAEVGERPPDLPGSLAELRTPEPVDAAATRKLFGLIRAAANPVLVLGSGVARSADAAAVRRFAESAELPVVTTMSSLGCFPAGHDLYLGSIGATGNPSAHQYLNERCDLLVAVGTGLDTMARMAIGPALSRTRVVLVNIDPAASGDAYPTELVVTGDAGEVFAALGRQLAETPFRIGRPASYELTRYVSHGTDPRDDPAGLSFGDTVRELQKYLPDKGYVLCDAGNSGATAEHLLTLPEDTIGITGLGQGGMGYSIGGAVGAQLGAAADERTTVVCGDGGFLMLGSEVHTAVDLGVPVLFLVLNDNQHGMCVSRQHKFFDGRLEATRYAPISVADVARGFGAPDRLWVGRAADRHELTARLAEYQALGDARPGVLEVIISRSEVPPVVQFVSADADTEPVPVRP
ncbi:thiamine pyrophosphate-binding protein [Amycolatopsis anabasis]|uniref:thiamine pyrophosphate-binding protein n=1 Tax=Amycolatopsis anabasis TaxID=1840409 RepID=UPI00131CDDF5|nr:thiamine pyrophosphate-binding protein [Amycolatopsis anabasis]